MEYKLIRSETINESVRHKSCVCLDLIPSLDIYNEVNESVGFHCFQSVDWWSLGVLTYELLTGTSPFTVDGQKNTQAEVAK